MALDAASAVAFIPVIAADGAPVARMWASFQASAGAVALDADIAVAVTALTRLEIAPCLDRVV